VFNETSAKATQLLNNFSLAPFVGAQQALVNQADFWQQLINDPSRLTEPDRASGRQRENGGVFPHPLITNN
jgi:hypothetical protein